MKKIFPLFILSIFALNNIGCSPLGVLSTGGATTMVVAEGDRSIGSVVDDATLKIKIAEKLDHRGYSEKEIEKVMGLNLLRVVQAVTN